MKEEDARLQNVRYRVYPPPVDPAILEAIAALKKSRRPRARELPSGVTDALRKYSPTNAAEFTKLLEATPFEIRSYPEWHAIIRLSGNYKFTPSEILDYELLLRKKVNRAVFEPNGDQEFEIYSLIPLDSESSRRLAAPKSHALDRYTVDKDLKAPNQIALYDAYFLTTAEEVEIQRLRESLDYVHVQKAWKRIESDLIREKVIDESTTLGGIRYADLHSDVAGAYVTVVHRLGPAFGPYVAHPGVINRPSSFIRDALPLLQSGKSPEEVWKILSSRTVTLYRKLGGDENFVRQITREGMRSAFLRTGGTERELETKLLTGGLNDTILDHIRDAKTGASPVISTTLNDHSVIAYSIARGHSAQKGAPIHEFAMNVPIYDIVVATNRSDATRKFEILVWGNVPPENLGHLGVEEPNRPLGGYEFVEEMKDTPDLPDFLTEPAGAGVD